MLLLETDLNRFSENDIQAIIESLPSSWQARILRKKPFRSRLQSAVGYSLLRQILQEQFGLTALPPLYTDEYGKPHPEADGIFFSISHCRCAVACIAESYPVAVDVQDDLPPLSPALAERIAFPEPPASLTRQELIACWTQKEASAKLDGRGLTIGLENLPFKEHHIKTVEYPTFVLSIATNVPQR